VVSGGVDTAAVGVFLSQQGPCCTAIELDNWSPVLGSTLEQTLVGD